MRLIIAVMVIVLCGCRSARHTAERVEATRVRLDSLHLDKEIEVNVDEWYFYHDTVTPVHCSAVEKLPVRAVRHTSVRKKTAAGAATKVAEVTRAEEEKELTAESASGCGLLWWWIGVAMAGLLVVKILESRY